MKVHTRAPFHRYRSRSASSMAETEQDKAFRHIAEAVQRINESVNIAVNAGITVELIRTSRCHNGKGNWGDQLTPVIPVQARYSAANGAAMITEDSTK